MMPPSRYVKSGGCWICKLRRKKCNESRPTCGDCANLKLQCQYGPKPSWMDGGALQKQKAASLKEAIKQHSAHRKEQAQNNKVNYTHDSDRRFHVISDIAVATSSLRASPTTSPRPNAPTLVLSRAMTPIDELTLVDTLPWSYQHHQRSDTLENASTTEWNFVMKYIDHVFPAMFPFYQPPIFDTGRSWMLLLLRKSRIAYHAALALSCYYFTMALSDAEIDSEHAVCKQMQWKEVDEATAKCFDSLRADISAMNLNGSYLSTTTGERVELMNSITQVIIFEIAMGKSTPWNTHLPAAIKLFEEIMATPEARPIYRGHSQSKFASVLLGIGDPLWTNSWPCNHIWSPEQTGFRFCAGYLLFVDIMASTVLGSTPRLARYYADVLAKVDDGEPAVGEAEIRLSATVGCRNSVAEMIGAISTKISLKQEVAGSGDPNLARALKLEKDISKDVDILYTTITGKARPNFRLPWPPLLNSNQISPIRALIWSHAAMLYRYTALGAWVPDDSEIVYHIGQTMTLLTAVPQNQLRTLAWPIFVTSCLARKEDQTFFTRVLTTLSRVQTVGPLHDARRLMQTVWQNRSRMSVSEFREAFDSGLANIGLPVLIL